MNWNLVDKPWNFCGVRYVLNDRYEHIVYITAKEVGGDFEGVDIPSLVAEKLGAVIDCTPIQHDRITREMKYKYVKDQFGYQKRYQTRKLDESGTSDRQSG